MINKGIKKHVALAVFGFVLLITGFILVISLSDAQGIMRTLPYICIGVGAGLFGGTLGSAIKNRILNKSPNVAKQIEIDTKDERNMAISNKAKAKAYDLMLIVYGALTLAFVLMQVDMYVYLTLFAAYLFIVFSMVYYINKYHKEM
ncbi:hypothetical protein [Candidatus Contubernalis alkaliaceticus]|uniref:hypothetical protein n=1 Tax=Candidatus Contubernalis alkaliaceticus TaxID=338645 RepID=UPI001F4C06C8|nr:hypothetical protein [Candidatus Contubernalis alkalaceticus]UNC92170.1 hypothetical protein HUE98_08735 [Candidatus Contubernalis alkalaceticus]